MAEAVLKLFEIGVMFDKALLPGGCNKAEELMRSLASMDQLKRVVAQAETHRVQLPGFGLPLYQRGDPRAACLIDLANKCPNPARHSDLVFRFVEDVEA